MQIIEPPFWARGGHPQTLWAHFLKSNKFNDPGERQEISVGADKLVGRLHRGRIPVLVSLFHGLGGDADSSFVQRVGKHLLENLSVSVLRMNLRGQGEGFGLARSIYHSGSAPDIGAVINYGRNLFPNYFQVVVGFSLSANMVLNLAALSSRDEAMGRPDYVISINPPVHLETCSLSLQRWDNKPYDISFVAQLRADKKKREDYFNLPRTRIPWNASLYDFDELYTAREGGFKNRQHYYEECSSLYRLPQIEIPTTVLMSNDDPFIPSDHLKRATLSKTTELILTNTGGHIGFISKSKKGFLRWMDEKILEVTRRCSTSERTIESNAHR